MSVATSQDAEIPKVGAASNDLPSADVLLQQSLEAMGGKEAMDKITSRESQGYMQTPNGEVTISIISADPDRFVIRQMVSSLGEFVFGYDGSTLWSRNPQGAYRLLDPATTSQVRQFDFHNLLTELMTQYPTRETVSRGPFGGHDAYQIKLTGQRPADQLTIFLDAETKLLRGQEQRKDAGPAGFVVMRYTFEEWKQFGEIKLFTKVSIAQGDQSVGTITFTEIEHNSVDAAAFEVPAEVQKLRGPGMSPPADKP